MHIYCVVVFVVCDLLFVAGWWAQHVIRGPFEFEYGLQIVLVLAMNHALCCGKKPFIAPFWF